MFGIELTRADWAGLVALAYLALRVLCAVSRVLWWYVTDARRVSRIRPNVPLVTGAAVATLAVALLSSATDWPFRGATVLAYGLAAAFGFVLGIMFDFVVDIRLWRFSNWLTSFRVPGYREQLLHGDEAVRLGAAERLAGLGIHARAARPELLAVVRSDESDDVRFEAAQAVLYTLREPIAEEDADLPREARPLLADADPRVRTVAAAVLVTFDAALPAELLPVLIGGLATRNHEAASISATALGKLGPAAEPAIPALAAAALDPDHPVGGAAEALGKIGAAAVPALIGMLETGNGQQQWEAADALGDMGEPARAALPALRKVAAHPDGLVSGAAKRAIRKLGGDVA